MAQYLVTGGAGFIGSNLAESILRAGDDVQPGDLVTARITGVRDVDLEAKLDKPDSTTSTKD